MTAAPLHPRDERGFAIVIALMAVLLLSGNCTLADFEDEAWRRPEVRALYPLVHRHPVELPEGAFPTEVEVTLTDVRRFATAVSMPAGSIAAPFTEAQLWGKFDGCVSGVLAAEARNALRGALESLPDLATAAPLMAPLKGPFA